MIDDSNRPSLAQLELLKCNILNINKPLAPSPSTLVLLQYTNEAAADEISSFIDWFSAKWVKWQRGL